MYLIKSRGEAETGVHGVDYTKGLEDGRMCGRVHPYWTMACRPLLVMEEELGSFKEDSVDYDSLTDREKLELGEPVFWGSPLMRALGKSKVKNRTEIAELDVQGQVIAREIRVREQYEDR